MCWYRHILPPIHHLSTCETNGALLVQAVRPMAWMGRRSSLLARYAVDATRRPVAARHLTEEARAKGSVATTLETRGVTPPNGRHTQTPSTYNPVFVPLRRHPRPMALVSKCPRRKVGGFSARAARCPRRSTSLCPSRRERLIFLDRDDSAGPASHHRPLLAARPVAEALSIKASVGDVAHVAFAAVYRGQRKIGCPVRYSRKA